MTFTSHLAELRSRLIKSVIALVITTIIAFVFAKYIFEFLIYPAGDITLIYIEMTEMLGTYMRVSLMGGVILSMPYIVYHIIMFISPALMRREKRYIYIALPWITVMFLGGVAFGYFIAVPPAAKFLTTFGSEFATPQIKIGNYISIVTRLLVAIGCVFQTPVIITLLARLGIVTPETLAKKRRWAIVLAFIVAAIVTPTWDPINQSIVAVPLIILYEMSIWLAKLAYRKRAEAQLSADYLS
ncbi:MAG: twin-arginine translocase subunit TatC [Dehalococcoidia bacterium]|nr:twin-arginine translocase subunit TatC [Dehalococcoidia bacterium]